MTTPTSSTCAMRRPRLIVEQNLYGVDIDPRCAQIAALALWLRAQRAWKDLGVAASERPRIHRTHIVVAEPMPGDAKLVEEFAARLDPPLIARPVQEDGRRKPSGRRIGHAAYGWKTASRRSCVVRASSS